MADEESPDDNREETDSKEVPEFEGQEVLAGEGSKSDDPSDDDG